MYGHKKNERQVVFHFFYRNQVTKHAILLLN
jgi:hypothetical protein